MRLFLAMLVFACLTGCSGYVIYEPEKYGSCACYQTDSLDVYAEFNNALIYPQLTLSCQIPVSELPTVKELSMALKRSESGKALRCDSISMCITNDRGSVFPVTGRFWPVVLPDSMLTPSRKITLTVENHYTGISDNPDKWYMQLITHTQARRLDSLYTFKAKKMASTLRIH